MGHYPLRINHYQAGNGDLLLPGMDKGEWRMVHADFGQMSEVIATMLPV